MLKVMQVEVDLFDSDFYQEQESLVESACRQVNEYLPDNGRIVNVDYKPTTFNDVDTKVLLTVFYTIPDEDVLRSL